jgi:hypothetical protein
MIDPADVDLLADIVATTAADLTDEFAWADPGLRVSLETAPQAETSQSPTRTRALAQFLNPTESSAGA